MGDLAAVGKCQIQIITNTVTFSDRKIQTCIRASLTTVSRILVVNTIMRLTYTTGLFSQNVFALCVCVLEGWDDDGGAGRLMGESGLGRGVGGKQDDRLVPALTAFLYLPREMTRRGRDGG